MCITDNLRTFSDICVDIAAKEEGTDQWLHHVRGRVSQGDTEPEPWPLIWRDQQDCRSQGKTH